MLHGSSSCFRPSLACKLSYSQLQEAVSRDSESQLHGNDGGQTPVLSKPRSCPYRIGTSTGHAEQQSETSKATGNSSFIYLLHRALGASKRRKKFSATRCKQICTKLRGRTLTCAQKPEIEEWSNDGGQSQAPGNFTGIANRPGPSQVLGSGCSSASAWHAALRRNSIARSTTAFSAFLRP